MPVSVEQDKTRYIVRLEGEIGVAEAAGLKQLLLEGLASGGKLQLDLERVEAIDVTFMQLLHGALHETDRAGTGLRLRMSETAETALRGAGFGASYGSRTGAAD